MGGNIGAGAGFFSSPYFLFCLNYDKADCLPLVRVADRLATFQNGCPRKLAFIYFASVFQTQGFVTNSQDLKAFDLHLMEQAERLSQDEMEAPGRIAAILASADKESAT
ncbi:MAG: hypothetical protein QJR02_01865 [Sinobacteraceae bacterium]|nr:hypothetical protein [Nevskiaceae bacterium]